MKKNKYRFSLVNSYFSCLWHAFFSSLTTPNSFSMHGMSEKSIVLSSLAVWFHLPSSKRLFRMFKGFFKLFLQFYLNKLWIKIHFIFTGELSAILFFIQQAKQRWCQLHSDWLKTTHHCPSRSLIGLNQNCTINS